MPSIAQQERSKLFVVAEFIGMNSLFYRNNTGELVGAHTSGDSTITFDGFSINASVLHGHTLTVDGNTYTVSADGTSNSSGVITLAITPVLSTSPADNSAVVVATTKTFYWSEQSFSTVVGDSPSNEIFEPLMVVSKEIKSALAKDNSYGGGFELDHGEITIAGRELFDDERYLRKIEPYEFSSRLAKLYVVGTDGETSYDWSNKVTLLDGLVGKSDSKDETQPDVVWTVRSLLLPVRSKGVSITGNWHRRLKGFGRCPFWPTSPAPDATIAVPAAQWDPVGDPFTLLFRLFIPEGESFDNTNVVVTKSDVSFTKSGGNFDFTVIDDNDTPHVAESTFDLTNGVWYDVAGVLDRTDEEVRFYIDGVLQDTVAYSGNNVRSTTTDDLCFGCLNATTGTFVGQICQIALFDTALTRAQIVTLQLAPIPSPSTYTNLLAYWPGDVDEVASPRELLDIGPDSLAAISSPWNGDLSSTVLIGTSMEGEDGQRGQMARKAHGLIRNSTPTSLDIDRFMFFYSDPLLSTQAPSRVLQSGASLTLEADFGIEDFIETTPTAADGVITCSSYSLMRLKKIDDNEEITIDYGGRSVSDGGYRLRRDDSEFKIFSTAQSAFSASFAIMFWITLYDETDGQVLFSCISGTTGWEFRYKNTGSTLREFQFRLYDSGNTIRSISSLSSIAKYEPHHFALVADESGGNLNMIMYMDGISVATKSVSSVSINNPAGAFNIGADLTPANYADMLFSEISIHDAVITQATIRDIVYRRTMRDDITSGPTAPTYATDLANYYGHSPREAQHVNGNLTDLFGSDNSTTGTDGTWVGGVAINSTLAALYDLLRFGGVDHDDIVTTNAFEAWMAQQIIGYESDKISTVTEMINAVKTGAAAQVPYNSSTGKYHIIVVKDPNDLTPVITIEQFECLGPITYGAREIPLRDLWMRSRQNPTRQSAGALLSSVNRSDAQFVLETWRYIQEHDALNEDLFPDHDITVTVDGIWFYEVDAANEVVRQMGYRGRKVPLPRFVNIPINRSRIDDSTVLAGVALTLNHTDLPNGVTRDLLIVSIKTDGRTATVRGWG